MRRPLFVLAAAAAAMAVLASPQVRRWLDVAMIRATGTTVRTHRPGLREP